MMDYAFPDDLARQIIKRWPTFSGRKSVAPPLPSPADLRHILATAFFASLEREEGRPLRFVLCCSPDLDVVRDGFGETVRAEPYGMSARGYCLDSQLAVGAGGAVTNPVDPNGRVRLGHDGKRPNPTRLAGDRRGQY